MNFFTETDKLFNIKQEKQTKSLQEVQRESKRVSQHISKLQGI